jgi:hypothetical protein
VPLKRILGESRNFDPRAVTILLEGFNGLVAELGLRETAEREDAAQLIMRLARGRTELDATTLRDEAVALMRSESSTAPRSSPGLLSSSDDGR